MTVGGAFGSSSSTARDGETSGLMACPLRRPSGLLTVRFGSAPTRQTRSLANAKLMAVYRKGR